MTFRPEYTPDADAKVAVWADTAAEAATKAFAGTITVTLAEGTFDHAFGPDTVGVSAAEQKPFLVTVSGNAVSLALEDMAGVAGADYDYDDRSFGGATVAGASAGRVFEETYFWPGQAEDPGDATVKVTVTAVDDQNYRWNYHIHNDNFFTAGESESGKAHIGIMPGQQRDFWFETPAQPIVPTNGRAGLVADLYIASGPMAAPGKGNVDITIDGEIEVGAGIAAQVTKFSPQDNTNEDTVGGLVVRNADSSKAKRQQITVNKLTDVNAPHAPVVGGEVKLTFPG